MDWLCHSIEDWSDPVLQWPSFDEVEGAAENLAVITLMLPRRCFLELYRRLHLGISKQAEIRWVVADGRLVPRRNAETFGRRKTKTQEAECGVREKAIADIPDVGLFLESQLGLRDRTPRDFDSGVLIKERLAETPRIYEDFFEPGDFTPVLKTPGKPTDGRDRSLSFGISSEAMNDLLTELGANWGKFSDTDPVAPDYPLLSRLNDVASDAVYQPGEINRLLAEVLRAQGQAKRPPSLRTLDKLYRIAKWAERDDTGVVFAGQ